ncbi:site-specific integrase [uncultured Roseovarius sp.]|uniref:tyrosine-type recombinase/integrase n=1 Tax=uncultured Roseovarius sp. TaxID=293344 RepID=UPI0026365E3D|nr:site-specific integrase [uncultured Roseovarius sp.]
MRKRLTDRFLETIKPSEGGRVTYSDTLRPGLQLRVGMRKASWVYEKRVKGGPKRKHTLGAYCTWTTSGQRIPVQVGLSAARERALEIELEAGQGVDRVELAERTRLAEERAVAIRMTVSEVLDIYERLKLSTLRTGQERARELRKVLSDHPHLPANDLTKANLQAIVDEKAAAGKFVYANRLRAYLRAFTHWASRRDYLKEDVGFDLEGTGREKARDRVLSMDEARRIYQVTFELGPLWGPMFRLLILTGQRRGEIATLRWSNVDLKAHQLTLPGSQTKDGKPHITHLSDPAQSELEELSGGRDGSEFVFTTTGKTPSSGISKAKRNLDKLLGDDVAHWRLHDLRRAMATALAGAGVPEGVVDRIQSHSASGSAPSAVARVYQQSDLLPQRAAALDRWAEMVTGVEVNVVRLSQ